MFRKDFYDENKILLEVLNQEHFLFTGLCSEDEERLVRDLFRGYNKLIRPVENMTHTVEVAFGLAFIQLINVVSEHIKIVLGRPAQIFFFPLG